MTTAPAPTRVVPTPVTAIECPDCSDANPCTTDSCDTATGFCRHAWMTCDDGDPCTRDYCDQWGDPNPGCRNVRLPDGSLCADAGVCVYEGLCMDGVCHVEPAPEGSSCEDASPCTGGDVCDGAGTCVQGPPWSEGTPCTGGDGDLCTSDEVCGFDETGAAVCRGRLRSCDDGDPCTTDECGPDGTCVNLPVSCYDGNTCTGDACDPRTGACVFTAALDGGGCIGPDRCTQSTCVAGNCVGTGAPGTICDVEGGCAVGRCNPRNPVLCEYTGDNSLCSQDGPCDVYYCAQSPTNPTRFECRGAGQCREGCNIGQCDTRGFCILTGSTPGAPCDDGNACTTNDTCGATCQGTPISCHDGDGCTLDMCDPVTGCSNPPDPLACDDRNPCTRDVCFTGLATCAYVPLDGVACDDGNACTQDTVCREGVCGGVQVACDDQNACTTDTCDPALGCRHTAVVCPSDNNGCTAEICNSVHGCSSTPLSGTSCAGDGNSCTADVCLAGVCSHPPINDGGACGAGTDPCGAGVCRSGRCAPSLDCNDGNQCTQDICYQGATCVHLPQPPEFGCDDGNPCTDADFCGIVAGLPACRGTPAGPLPLTCGIGACARTVDACAGGVPQACVPGAPGTETCNGIDDDCDGIVDENRIRAMCALRPLLLVDPPMRTEFMVTCRFRDRCNGSLPLPPGGLDADAVWVSRADRFADPNDNITYPDPATLACPDPQVGTEWERGIVENAPARMTGADTAMFEFNLPHDSDCATLDGDSGALLDRLSATPNGLILVCVSGRYAGAPWEGCALGLLRRMATPTPSLE